MPCAEAPAPAISMRWSPNRFAAGAERDIQAGKDGRRGALDVVVERAQPAAEPGELRHRVLFQEVFPLEDGLRIDAHDRLDEPVDERLIAGAANPSVAHAEIQRIVQQFLVVGADVEHDRQRQVRRDAGTGGVQTEFANRNAHAADALIAEAEDPFAVGHDDHGWRNRMVRQDPLDPILLLVGDIESARPPEDVRELLARFADHRRVDDRQHLLDVVVQQAEEQRLVAVLERGEVDVFLDRRRLRLEILIHAIELLLDRRHRGRDQAVEMERFTLAGAERRPLVDQRVGEHGRAPRVHRDVWARHGFS